ncbi:MAG: NTP transferase domain-containing protein, partial [Corynebacterium sp.]|nr:NTP transferase domain-containing protein [Corynebacterium sp.]
MNSDERDNPSPSTPDTTPETAADVNSDLAANTDAVILVGGKGTRLRPLTNSIPKPMLPVAGYPFLQHLLGRIREAGMTHVVLGTSYKAEVFEEHFGD